MEGQSPFNKFVSWLLKSPTGKFSLFASLSSTSIILLLIAMVGVFFFATNTDEAFGDEDAGVRDSSCNGLLYPNVLDETKYAEAIDRFIPDSSPLSGLGRYFVSGGKKTGINPSLIVAHAKKESSFGTAGIATRGTHNAFGRTATSSQPHVIIGSRKWYKWSTWQASLDSDEDDEPSYIKRRYVDEGITNLKDYVYKYAPPSENDSDAYIAQLRKWMEEIAEDSNGGVTCE